MTRSMKSKSKPLMRSFVVQFFRLAADGSILARHEVCVEESNANDAYDAARDVARKHMSIDIPARSLDWAHSISVTTAN